MGESITIFCAVLGLLIAWQTFRGKTPEKSSALEELRTIVLEKFDLLQRTNEQLRKDLTAYGNRNDSFQEMYMQGLTLQQCINILEEVREKVLTDDSREVFEQTPSQMRLESLKQNLDIQLKHHIEMQTYFALYIKPGMFDGG